MRVIQAFHEGGFFMYFILVLGVLTVSLVIERGYTLFLKIKSGPKGFRGNILNYLQRQEWNAAIKFAETNPSPLAKVVAVGCRLKAKSGGEEEVQARMDEALSKEISRIDRRTGFLAMFGNVATLLGLLGTISGMIQSFAGVANANPADRATLLSKGISEAMNCTAFGLIVAIPALLAYAVLQNRTDRLVTELTEGVTALFNDLLFEGAPLDSAVSEKSYVSSRKPELTV